MRAVCEHGPYTGMSAIGTGSNVKTRRRSARLALALAAALENPSQLPLAASHELFAQLYKEACEKRPPAVEAQSSGHFDAAVKRSDLPDTVSVEPPGVALAPAAPSLPMPERRSFTAGLQPPPPPGLPPQGTAAAAAAQADLAIALRAVPPQECLHDPFAELKDWEDGGKWPYCTACRVWSDLAHIRCQRHVRRLTSWGYLPSGASGPSPTLAAAPTAPGETAGLQPPTSGVPGPPWQQPYALGGHPKRAPPTPTPEQIYDWNAPWVHFNWKTLECSEGESGAV